jgi:hypothetical protein
MADTSGIHLDLNDGTMSESAWRQFHLLLRDTGMLGLVSPSSRRELATV